MQDDGHLVRQTIEGDRAAFGLLYDRYARVIRAICFDATHDPHAAQDLAQEAFLRGYRRLAGLRNPDRFGPWLVTIAKHVCREWLRTKRRDRHRYPGEVPDPNRKPTHDREDAARELRMAIATLPERERVALHLFYLQENPADVARGILGLSHASFYRLLAQARTRLAEILSTEQETVR